MKLWLILCFFWISTPALATSPLPRPTVIEINGTEFVLIPASGFWMTIGRGNPDRYAYGISGKVFRDVHIWLDDYYIARHEARATDFVRFMNSKALADLAHVTTPSGKLEDQISCSIEKTPEGHWQLSHHFADNPDLPATGLSWNLANAFAQWMGFRLPTEAEWQKAARGPNDRRLWPWGNEYPDDTYGHFEYTLRPCHPAPVTAYPKGVSLYGIYNMAGNVAEWVADWENFEHDDSLRNGMRNPPLASAGRLLEMQKLPNKFLKGGRWGAGPESISIPIRIATNPDGYFNAHDGVRFSIDADEVDKLLLRGVAKEVGQ